MLVLGFRRLARSSLYVWCSTSQSRNPKSSKRLWQICLRGRSLHVFDGCRQMHHETRGEPE